jgi:hypothetical protein
MIIIATDKVICWTLPQLYDQQPDWLICQMICVSNHRNFIDRKETYALNRGWIL